MSAAAVVSQNPLCSTCHYPSYGKCVECGADFCDAHLFQPSGLSGGLVCGNCRASQARLDSGFAAEYSAILEMSAESRPSVRQMIGRIRNYLRGKRAE